MCLSYDGTVRWITVRDKTAQAAGFRAELGIRHAQVLVTNLRINQNLTEVKCDLYILWSTISRWSILLLRDHRIALLTVSDRLFGSCPKDQG